MGRDEGNKKRRYFGKDNAEKVLWMTEKNKLDLHPHYKFEFLKMPTYI